VKPNVEFSYVDQGDGDGEQPMLVLWRVRTGRQRYKVMIPQRLAHVFVSEADNVDGSALYTRCSTYCDVLYGHGQWLPGEAKAVCDLVLDNLDKLIRMPPAPDKSKKEVEKAIERAGLKFTVNGTTLVDAS